MDTAQRTVTRLTVTAVTVVTVIIGVSFWLSYAHLAGVAHRNGITDNTLAWAWPGIIDLFIAGGEIMAMLATLRREVDRWAIGMTVFGLAASIAFNVAGVGAHAGTLEYAVAAAPPVASGLSFAVLMQYLYRAVTRAHTPVTPAVTVEREHTPTPAPAVTAPPAPALPPAPARSRLVTVKEAADLLGVSTNAIHNRVSRGTLTPVTAPGVPKMFDRDTLTGGTP